MRLALRIGGLAIAVAILVGLVVHLGPREIAGQLALAGPGFVWILVLHAASIAVAAIPWFLLLPSAVRPTLGGAIASRFVAQGANAMLPMFGLGGELVRLLWLRKGERAPGLAAIIVDRLMYVAGSATVLIAGVVGLSQIEQLPAGYTRAAAVTIVLLVVVVAGGLLVTSRYGIAARVHRLVLRMRRKLDEGHQFGEDVDDHVERMLHRRARTPWIAWLCHLTARTLIGIEIAVGFYLLGVPLSFDEALVFSALPIMLAVTSALVPNQLGVHEGAQALVGAAMGISPTTAVAVVLLLRLRQLAGVALIAVLVVGRRSKLVPESASSESEVAPDGAPAVLRGR